MAGKSIFVLFALTVFLTLFLYASTHKLKAEHLDLEDPASKELQGHLEGKFLGHSGTCPKGYAKDLYGGCHPVKKHECSKGYARDEHGRCRRIKKKKCRKGYTRDSHGRCQKIRRSD